VDASYTAGDCFRSAVDIRDAAGRAACGVDLPPSHGRVASVLMRLVLLAFLAFGVVGMHTAGHEGMPHRGAMPAVHESHSTVMITPGDLDPPADMSMVKMCLAVIGVGLLFALALLLLAAAAPSLASALPSFLPSRSGRGPPDTVIGLQLASASVMRT